MDLYSEYFPLMSNLPGTGSPIIQNIAGFPSGISGNVLPEQNAMARYGPSGFYVPLLSPVARAVEQAESRSNVQAAVEAPFNFFQTAAGEIVKRGLWSFFGYSLVIVGVVYLLWGPAKKGVTKAVEVVA